jgi:hypothetical protein
MTTTTHAAGHPGLPRRDGHAEPSGGKARSKRIGRRGILLASVGALIFLPLLGWTLYALLAWLSFGPPRTDAGGDLLMSRHMPRHDIAEVHRIRVNAPAGVAYDALLRMDLQQSSIIRGIFRARELLLGARGTSRATGEPFLAELRSLGWGVLDTANRRLVLGAVTQPWQSNVVFRSLPPAAFARWDSVGYVKIVVTFAADSLGPNLSEVRTETRALATDADSRAKFRRYWSIFSPGILLIRTQSLELVRRDAERIQGVPARH